MINRAISGGLFDYNLEESRHAFLHAIQHANEHILQEEEDKLDASIKEIPAGNEFQVSQVLCNMLQVCLRPFIEPLKSISINQMEFRRSVLQPSLDLNRKHRPGMWAIFVMPRRCHTLRRGSHMNQPGSLSIYIPLKNRWLKLRSI